MTDHKANAIQNLRSLHDWQSDEGATDATLTTVAIEAVAQATLYLAEQQRIGNLIAYNTYILRVDEVADRAGTNLKPSWLSDEQVTRLNESSRQIREGLGLK